jgi:hypothetical protein
MPGSGRIRNSRSTGCWQLFRAMCSKPVDGVTCSPKFYVDLPALDMRDTDYRPI